MHQLRAILAEREKELYEILIKNWEIAEHDWLPAIGVKLGSFNSFPHVRNVEQFLDQILLDEKGNLRIPLSSLEIYILLASALFHDIGKGVEDSGNNASTKTGTARLISPSGRTKAKLELAWPTAKAKNLRMEQALTALEKTRLKKETSCKIFVLKSTRSVKQPKKRHGEKSKVVIENNAAWLGIHSKEIAGSIARISNFHDIYDDVPEKKPKESELAEALRLLGTVVIHPYGAVREKLLAALLVLADRLDSVSTRVMPEYLSAGTEIEAIGKFRRLVPGVKVDHQLRMIRTSLGNEVSQNENDSKKTQFDFKGRPDIDIEYGKNSPETPTQPTALEKQISETFRFTPDEYCVVLRKARVKLPDGLTWPQTTVLAMLMSDVLGNAAALKYIQDELDGWGLPLYRWVIDYKGHLYTPYGRETHEPIFSTDYLKSVAEAMWDLSTQIFGVSLLTYENLADQIGDADIERVKTAVQRIVIVTSSMVKPDSEPLWAGDTHWRWGVKKGTGGEEKPCKFQTYKEVEEALKTLEDTVNA